MKKNMVWIRLAFTYFFFLTLHFAYGQCNDPIITGYAMDAYCDYDCSGSIDITVTGGTSPYSYQWDMGFGTQDIWDLCPGVYSVTVTDAAGCSSVATYFVNSPAYLIVDIYIINYPVNNNGALGANVSGGTGPYSFQWSTGDYTSEIFNLSPGIYCLTVYDGNGCYYEDCVELINDLEAEIDGPAQLCIGECGTYIGYDASGGGSGGYSYVWYDDGGTVVSTAQSIDYCPNFSGTSILTLELYDQQGNAAFTEFLIDVVTTIPLEIVSTSPASCPDNNSTSACDKTCANSTITYTVPGSQNMDLNWEVLGAESYEVDNNIVTVNWGGPGTGEINVMSGEVAGGACEMQLNCLRLQKAPFGIATVNHGFGQGPFTYLWSDDQTTQTIYNLQGGTYQVTVTDGIGQTGTCEVLIDTADSSCADVMSFELIDIFHPSCNSGSGGFIGVYPNNPNSNYSYDWSNGISGPYQDGLPAGQYCVTVTDQINGCTLDQCFVICDPPPMTVHTYMIDPPFPGNPVGSAGIQVFGGAPPYDYDWGFGPTSDPIITGLTEGTYAVIVTDGNGCTTVASIDIYGDPTCPINAYIEIDDQPSSCFINDGAITVNIVGGAAPYDIDWSDGPAINSLVRNDLANGYYCVFVTDANDCQTTACVTLDCNDNLIPTTCIGLGSLCIDIIDEPHAQFSSDPPADATNLIELCLGETVSFYNESENAENYVWQLGDGYSTASLDVTHAYTQSGVYDVLLIARNECFCFDTTSVKVLVSDSEIPHISCEGTVCTNEEVTYTTTADCNNFIWTITNGTISGGGGPTDDYVTVDWGVGPIGEVTLQVSSCTGDYCANPTSIQIPIITDGVPIEGPAKVCPGEIGTYSIPLWSATEYVWSASPFGEIKSGQGSNTVTIKWNVEIPTNDLQWVHVEYNNCYLECGGESTKDVTITPDFYLAGPIEVCEEGSSDYAAFDEISNAPVPCNWTVLDPGGAVFWTANGATAVTIDWPLGAGKYTLMANAVTPDDYCTDDYTIFVNINAGPPVVNGIDGQNSICPGEYYTYQVVSTQANVAFDWVINNGGVMTETSGSTINVEWGMSQPYELTVTQTSTAGLACESQPFTMSIQPIASVSLDGPTEVCIEATTQYTAPSIGNALYDWTISPSSAGSVLTGQGGDTIDIIWHEAGVAIVSVAVCGVSEDLPVTVYGYPVPIVLHPDTICVSSTGLVSTSTSFSSYSWRNESGTQISAASTTNLGPGFYELVVTNSAGCEGQTTFRIHEYPLPVINISTPSLDFYCISAGFPIPTLYALNTEEGYTYQWYHNGSPLGVFANTYTPTGPGSFYVEVIDINGCTNNSNTFFLAENCGGGGGGGNPAPGVGCSGVDNIFSNGPTCDHGLFENISTNYVPGSVQWNFDDPPSGANNFSNLEDPEHFFSNAGFYGVQMAVQMLNGDICIIHKEFEVPAEANFDYVSTCPGLPVTFEDITNFTPGTTITNWDWDFGNPASGAANTSNLQHPEHIYENVGTYTVTLTINAQTGCSSTITRDVTVLSPPVASFDAPNLSCAETALAFNINITPGVTSFDWDFGDPASGGANTSQLASTFHAFSTPGVFDVKLRVYNIYGCTDSTTLTVPIDQNNLGGIITMDPGSPICEGDNTDATAPPGGVSWIWSEGSTTETINSSVASVFTVTITDDLGCTYSPPEAVLDIIAQPEATIKVTEYNEYGQPADCFFNGYILCEGEDVFLSITGAGDYSYTWSNGQNGDVVIYDEEHGGTLSTGDHVFEVTVTDNVTGCTSVEGPFTITVNPVPTDIQIISSPPSPICEQTTAVFTVSNPDPDLTYLWSTGEYGLTITASTFGEYFVRGISSFGCEGESNVLGIYAALDINLVPDGCHSRCTPDTICLPNMPDIAMYQWYFNGTAIPAPAGIDPNFKPTQSGAYHVDLVDVNGCLSTSDPFSIDLLPTDTSELELITCEDESVEYAGEILFPGSVTEFHFDNQYGCDSMITVSVAADINYEEEVPLVACENGFVNYEGVDYFPGTADTLELTSQFGCDSLVMISVTALPTHADSLSFNACMGTTVLYEGENLTPGSTTYFGFVNQYGCDSTVTVSVLADPVYSDSIELAGCEGTTVEYEGVDYPVGTNQTFALNTVEGCDSTIQLNIEALPQYNELLELSTCAGSILSLPDGLELEAGADTTLFLVTEAGCDSTVQITVEAVSTFEINIDLQTCEGSTVEYEGTDYPPGTDLEFNFVSQQGCDSTVYLTVEALPVQSDTIEFSACTGSTVEYNGMDLEPGTTTEIVLTNQFDCDSTIMVTVAENLSYVDTLTLSACEGTMVNYEGVDYPAGTNQTFEMQTTAGCDSTIHLNIEALSAYNELLELSTCTGSVLTLPGGLELEAGADTTLFFISQGGCDSTVQITVESIDGYEINVELEACDGSSVIYEGTSYPTGTDLEFNYLSQQGCDSTVYLTVEALPVQSSSLQLAACTGTTVEYNGSDLEPGSTTEFELTNQYGCDSTVTVNVIENLTYYEQIDLEGCDGEPVIYEGNSYPAGTIQQLDYLTIAGCDSTIVLNIAALPLSEENLELFACEGSTVEYNGDDLSPGVVLSYTFANQFDCDSTVVVSVSALPVQNETVNLSGCDGQTVTFDGIDYPAGTQATLTFVNQFGCDSIINLNIAALPTYVTPITLQACVGESIEYNGDDLAVGSTTEYDLVSTDGCDSLVIVTVEAYPTFDYEVNSSDIICWNSDTAYIEISALTGGTEPFNFSLDDFNYQDNPAWNNLGSGDYTVYVQDANGCVDETPVSIPEIPTIEMAFDVPLIECDADSVLLQSVLISGFTDSMTYEWQHGASGTTIPVYNPGVYILQATNLCETQNFEVEVALEDGYRENYFYIPNAFSPNGDGINDIFKAYAANGLTVLEYELRLFDRWGNTLYATTDIDESWDGSFQEEHMNPGVYVWWLKARVLSCRNEVEVFEKGDVTIIK